MSLREIYARILAAPFVYDFIRPLAVGLIDFAAIARFCEVDRHERVVDIGCGTGSVLQHLSCAGYLGVDVDGVALARASRFRGPNVRFLEGDDWDAAVEAFQPDVALMMGVVHHLSDDEFRTIAGRLVGVPRIVAMDVSYFAELRLSNLFSRLDRGCFVREQDAYEELYRECGLEVEKKGFVDTRLGYVRYVGFHLRWQDVLSSG